MAKRAPPNPTPAVRRPPPPYPDRADPLRRPDVTKTAPDLPPYPDDSDDDDAYDDALSPGSLSHAHSMCSSMCVASISGHVNHGLLASPVLTSPVYAGANRRHEQRKQAAPPTSTYVYHNRCLPGSATLAAQNERHYSQLRRDKDDGRAGSSVACAIVEIVLGVLLSVVVTTGCGTGAFLVATRTDAGREWLGLPEQGVDAAEMIDRCLYDVDESSKTSCLEDRQVESFIRKIINSTAASIISDMKSAEPLDGNNYCSAHLYLNSSSCSQPGTDGEKLCGWSDIGEQYYKTACVEQVQGGSALAIRHPGVYVIYTHLAICRDVTGSAFVQKVYRRPGGSVTGARPLIEDTVEMQSNGRPVNHVGPCGGSPVGSSMAFGVVRLDRNDEVWIEANPGMAVYRSNQASYFGLYPLR